MIFSQGACLETRNHTQQWHLPTALKRKPIFPIKFYEQLTAVQQMYSNKQQKVSHTVNMAEILCVLTQNSVHFTSKCT